MDWSAVSFLSEVYQNIFFSTLLTRNEIGTQRKLTTIPGEHQTPQHPVTSGLPHVAHHVKCCAVYTYAAAAGRSYVLFDITSTALTRGKI